MSGKIRCSWCGDIPIYVDYHDSEWGRPVHDDNRLFEMLILEGAQAGLSWLTILKKRENYRAAFDGFDPTKVALYDDAKIQELLANPGIVRNKLKIIAAVANAKAVLRIQEEYGSFDYYLWGFVDNKPIVNRIEKMEDFVTTSPISDRISKDLKKRGCNFIGSTIIYAFMQAAGMVNDHFVDCFVYKELMGEEAI
jgi:DNA-3-methyladenine glycosylase I